MKPVRFSYLRPSSVSAMLELMGEHGEDGKVLAGGQSLVPAMNFRLARPEVLLDLNGLKELDYLRLEGEVLRIGALVRHAAFHQPVVDLPIGVLLAQVAPHIAHLPIRHRGTFVGSLAHADPASEWCLVASTLDAQMVARSVGGERTIPASSYFQGALTTDLRSDELLVEVRLPLHDKEWRGGFYEFSRRAGDFALAMSVVALRLEDGSIAQAKLGISGVSDRPIRLSLLEGQMVGRQPTGALFCEIGQAASESIEPSGDIHASTPYRRDLIRAVVARALAQACA